MIIQEIIDLAKGTVLSSLSVRDKDSIIRNCIYLSLIELYKRFNLSIESETVHTTSKAHVYDLRNTNIAQILAVYDSNGKELTSPTVINDDSYDYKQLNYRSFILTNPKEEDLLFIYKASPKFIKDSNEHLDLPTDFIPVMLDYIAYRCHSTINKDNVNEANIYYQRFEHGCQILEQQGYKININTASQNIRDKGFI